MASGGSPAAAEVQGERLGGRQARGIEHVGEHGPHDGPALPADVAQALGRGGAAAARLHEPVGVPAPLGGPPRQAPDLAEAVPPVAPDEPPAALRPKGRESHAIAVGPVGEHQRVPREGARRGLGAGQLPRHRIGAEVEGATEPVARIVDGEETAGEHHRPLGQEELPRQRFCSACSGQQCEVLEAPASGFARTLGVPREYRHHPGQRLARSITHFYGARVGRSS